MFACPDCHNLCGTKKRKYIQYIKAYKRYYKCTCGCEFATEEVLALKRLRGRPSTKKNPLEAAG